VRRRFVPHQLRYAHAVELSHTRASRSMSPTPARHTNLGVISTSLQGIDNAEIIASVHAPRRP
jgi:hypothetical protein